MKPPRDKPKQKPKPQPLKRLNLAYVQQEKLREARNVVQKVEHKDTTSSIPPPPGYRAIDYNAMRERQVLEEDVRMVSPNNEDVEIVVSPTTGMTRHGKI